MNPPGKPGFLYSHSLVVVFMIIISINLIITGCGAPHVLMKPPELLDKIAPIKTGYYTVHKIDNGEVAVESGNSFLGQIIYLYKDKFFNNNTYFTGVHGSFLPNYYIKTRLVNSQIEVYWQDAADKDIWGKIVGDKIDTLEVQLSVATPNGSEEKVALRYYAEKIARPEIKTKYIAHRGTSYQPPTNYEGIYPANTMPGFEAALRSGFDGFELDVRITEDKRFIVSHDEDLSVATTIKGYVADKNISELKDVMVVKSAAIPEKKSTAQNAFIAAPIPTLKEVLDTYLRDPRMQTIVVDIKPDTKENILTAAAHDFSNLDVDLQKKILFLTRSPETAAGLRELVPHSDIALEGPLGTEPLDEDKREIFYPEAVGRPRGGHNTISFSINLVMAFRSEETILEKVKQITDLNDKYGYKVCMWTIARDWRLNFLRENMIIPEYLLTDFSYYRIGLEQLRFNEGEEIEVKTKRSLLVKRDFYPTYKKLLNDHVLDFWYQSRNMFEINYGVGSPQHNDIENDFAPVGNWEFKYGRSERNKFSKSNVKLNERYLFISVLNSKVQPKVVAENEITTESIRFGIGSSDGIGYYGGSGTSFTPYVDQSFVWTRLVDFSDSIKPENGEPIQNDYTLLSRYQGGFRFGDRSVYGLKVELASLFQLNAHYETAVVYPRHLFWYWSGSFILSQIGYGLLSHFTDDIVTRESIFGPLVNFVLKSAYLYGYYTLRKDKMNWPFNTEAPLRYETVNLGVSIIL